MLVTCHYKLMAAEGGNKVHSTFNTCHYSNVLDYVSLLNLCARLCCDGKWLSSLVLVSCN
jgi:hypothetical protein